MGASQAKQSANPLFLHVPSMHQGQGWQLHGAEGFLYGSSSESPPSLPLKTLAFIAATLNCRTF